MKKTQKKLPKRKLMIVTMLLVFLFSIFKVGKSVASTETFELTKVVVGTASDDVEVNNVKFEGNKITNDVTYHKVGDSITYNVTLLNNNDKNYTVQSITDDNENEYITYEYDSYEGTKFNAKDELTLAITQTYSKDVEDLDKRNQIFSVTFSLVLQDEDGNVIQKEIKVNPEGSSSPKTGDNIGVYITTAIASLIMLIVVSRKNSLVKISTKSCRSKGSRSGKHSGRGMKFFSIFLAMVIILPSISKAATASTYEFIFENDIKLMDKVGVTYVIDGEEETKVIDYNTKAELETPEKQKYVFTNWLTEDGSVFNTDTLITEDIKLYAEFDLEPYTIVFDKNGSDVTGTMENQKAKYGEATKLNKVAYQRAGYNFNGWNTAANGSGTSYADEADIENPDNNETITLYVQWKESTAIFDKGAYVGNGIAWLYGIDREDDPKLCPATAIKRYNGTPDFNSITKKRTISAINSNYPIYAWADGNTVYWWTEAEKVMLNQNCSSMFGWVFQNIEEIDLSGISTHNVKSFAQMFYGCENLKWDKINISFDTSNATDMSQMFSGCQSFVSLDLSNFDTRKVTLMYGMFSGCSSLQSVNVSSFNTERCTAVSDMFNGCSSLQVIDISNFVLPPRGTRFTYRSMFNGCTSLKTIYANGDWSEREAFTSATYVFRGCKNLVGGNGMRYNSRYDYNDYQYAKDKYGYFTHKD